MLFPHCQKQGDDVTEKRNSDQQSPKILVIMTFQLSHIIHEYYVYTCIHIYIHVCTHAYTNT